MSSIIEELKKKTDFYCEKGASEEQVAQAEKTLGLVFADDYREYIHQYGSVSCGGHELTGFSADANLSVVDVTIENKKKNPSIPAKLYVIEETHIDGIVIWQDKTGAIYKTEYKTPPKKEYNSLMEYVSTFSSTDTNGVESKATEIPAPDPPQTATKGWKEFFKKLFG